MPDAPPPATPALTVALAQVDLHVGHVDANLATIRAARAEAARMGADVVVTPEFSLGGYPPEDLVRKPAFIDRCEAALRALADDTADDGPALIVGGPWRHDSQLFNAAFVLDGGRVLARRAKRELPNYGVFDEKRVFDPGPPPACVDLRGVRLGLMVCEDFWLPAVSAALKADGADLLLAINASPFEDGKQATRVALGASRTVETGLPFLFLGQVGGQDEVVFDGGSFVLNADGARAVQMPFFEPALAVSRWDRAAGLRCAPQPLPPEPGRMELIYRCLMAGLAGYVRKNGFPGVVVGLTGGLDSALAAAVAVDALGSGAVRGVVLPGPDMDEACRADAANSARLLGIGCDTVPIDPALHAFGGVLPLGTEAANLPSRCRGLALMALSNATGALLLGAGDKSEMSVGHAVLYGDMWGGFSVLKDVYRSTAAALARWRNTTHPPGARGPAIAVPDGALAREHDSGAPLPLPFPVLDAILEGLVEGEESVDSLAACGHDRAEVLRVWRMLDRAEFKRRQAPPGVKITARSFGRDRRYPITNGFTELVA